MKTIILTDSTSDISPNQLKAMNVEVLPLTVTFGETSYIDGVTLDKKQFYQLQQASPHFPVTSQVNPDAFLTVFEQAKQNGDEVVYIAISSALSGTMQSAVIAKDMCDYEAIYIVDSQSASLGEHALLLQACAMREKGKSAAEIAEYLQSIIGKLKIYAAVDTLKYLIQGGRISKAAGAIGGVLNLKPIITLKDGKIEACAKARGRKNAFETILNQIKNADVDTTLPMIITHSNNIELMLEFRDFLQENGVCYDFIPSEVGCVIGTHTGPDCVGLSFFEK